MLDPLSAFVFATLFSMLNGAVLGFIHPALTSDLQPSAADWRIGTLLVAGGATLFIGQAATNTDWVIPIANGTATAGLAATWGDMVGEKGFQLGAVTNTTQSFEKSVVMYERGHKPEARQVAKRLGISKLQLMTAEIRGLAGGADVVVVVGEDNAATAE